jgi:Mrp family chromosome partitioning ATPase
VGLTFGMILSAMTVVQTSYQTYNVNGSFAVSSKNVNGQYVGGYPVPNTNDFHLAEDMVDAVRYVLRSERVLNAVINENELLGYTVPQLRNAVTVTQYNSTQILEMRVTWRNAEEGVKVWNAILKNANDILPQTLQLGSLEIINEPRAEQIGVVGGGNNRVVLFTLLGFLAGVGFAVIELLMHPTLNNVRDVESLFGVETVGVIPRDDEYYKRRGSIMTKEDVGNSLVVQNFSAAAYIVRNRLGTREQHHCFYVTSAAAGEGKTTVAANLAIQLSDMEHKTLLIDFDTRNPNLGALSLNKVDYEHSLNAVYRGDVRPEEAITTLSGYLDILPAVLEHNAVNVDNMLIELVENLKQQYEYVIMDAPPVGEVSGTLSLNQVASSVLFVIGYDNASLPEIQSSLEKLDKSGTRVLGCVVNRVVSGKMLGITQTADDRKKIISKKAAEKKKSEESYGFDDKVNPNESPEELQKAKGGRKERKKKEKRGLFGRKKEEPADAPKAESNDAPEQKPAVKRNVYEDSIAGQTGAKSARTDQETMNELLRMSLTNDWGSDQDKKPDSPDGEKPAEQK